jgi:hypothetical protein
MLNRFDDYPIHQTSEPIAHVASGDRNAYDRYWFNGFAKRADFFFAAACGLYPNRRVMDAAFSVVDGGRQYVVRASRLAPRERTETRVGPITVEVLEPMNRIRLIVEPNEFGLSADVSFGARTVAIEEPKMLRRSDARIVMDSTRFTQFGAWEGWIELDGVRKSLSAQDFLGTRDRSWGVRTVGEPEAGAPSSEPPQFYWVWAPIHFEDCCTLFQSAEHADGRPWHRGARMAATCAPGTAPHPTEAEEPRHMASAAHRIEWQPGTRRACRASITMTDAAGDEHRLELEPQLLFPMRGLGYFDAQYGHGLYKGELEISGDRWTIDDLDPCDPRNMHVQQLCLATMDGKQGIGVLEQLPIGPHAPSGFVDLFDVAGRSEA